MSADLKRRIVSITGMVELGLAKATGPADEALNQHFKDIIGLLSSRKIVKSERVRLQVEVQQLIKQAQAAIQVSHTLTGKWHVLKAFDENARDVIDPTSRPISAEGLNRSSPNELSPEMRRMILSGEHEIIAHFDNIYQAQIRAGQRIDHTQLKLFIKSLAKADLERWTVVRVLTQLWSRNFISGINGTPFDLEIIQIWLRLVTEAGSFGEISRILWLVLDFASSLKMTNEFLTLVTICIYRLISFSTTSQEMYNSPQRQELRHLHKRIARMRREQTGLGMTLQSDSRVSLEQSVRSDGEDIEFDFRLRYKGKNEISPFVDPALVKRFEMAVEEYERTARKPKFY